MIESTGGSRLLLEPAAAIGVLRERCREDFDRNVASQLLVASAVHLAHAPRAERSEDFESSKPIAKRTTSWLPRL